MHQLTSPRWLVRGPCLVQNSLLVPGHPSSVLLPGTNVDLACMQIVLESLFRPYEGHLPNLVVASADASSVFSGLGLEQRERLSALVAPEGGGQRSVLAVLLYTKERKTNATAHFGAVFAWVENGRCLVALHETMSGSTSFESAMERIEAELLGMGELEVTYHVIDAKPQDAGSNACGVRTVLAVDTLLRAGALLDVPWDDLPDQLDALFNADGFAEAYDGAHDDGRAHFCQLMEGVYAAHAAPVDLV